MMNIAQRKIQVCPLALRVLVNPMTVSWHDSRVTPIAALLLPFGAMVPFPLRFYGMVALGVQSLWQM